MPLTNFYMYILSTNVILYNQKCNYQIQECNIEGAVIYLMDSSYSYLLIDPYGSF